MEQDKWAQAGWRIEQKYGSKVLIGNWAEERLQFTREPKIANSTSRAAYRSHWDFKPDVSERRSALLRAEGIPYKMLFTHQSPPSSDYLVTQYQESYVHKQNNALPILQPQHPDNSTQKPERSDQPVSPLSTKSGLLHSTNRCFEKQQSHLPSLTVNGSAYQRHPLSAFCQNRFARASRMLSSHFYAANHNNKDLHLRDRFLLQVPDCCISQN
ncbi:uncharacterized protein C1orf158 homolog [Melanotaenia boesemani]|uniref:uncharacterized protein C1orf158 homolog n=1 Tax=Melanotaenia boesemani TaxID=1250792 RepID=UPI001C055198|nr:uncharacterized protein C1orf158 homolog [Melanotaenia boesemani]